MPPRGESLRTGITPSRIYVMCDAPPRGAEVVLEPPERVSPQMRGSIRQDNVSATKLVPAAHRYPS